MHFFRKRLYIYQIISSQNSTIACMSDRQTQYKGEIIKHFYFNGVLSCAGASVLMRKSLPLVTRILNELVEEGVLVDSGLAHSTGGRRPQVFTLAPNLMYVVAVAMDQFVTRIALMDMQNNVVIGVKEADLTLPQNPQSLQQLAELLEDFIVGCGISRTQIAGVGIGMPGFIDVKKGLNHSFLTPPIGESITGVLKRRLHVPVFIDNDSSLIALAESKFGEARGKHNCMVINIGWGVGLGLVIHDELFRGDTGFAGEFSHIPLFTNNKLCSCGKLGCLETEASLVVLVNRVKEGIKQGKSTLLSESLDQMPLEDAARIILQAAIRGDRFVVEQLGEVAYNIGRGIAVLIHILNPSHVVLSGRGAAAGNLWLAPVQKAINENCIPRISEKTTVTVSSLGHQAELIGATALVMENMQLIDLQKLSLAAANLNEVA